MHQLIPILGFLFYILLFLTLRYGFHHRNKYVKIYSILLIVWEIFVLGMNIQESFIIINALSPLDLVYIIIPLIPLWIIYRKRDRTEENRRWREMGGKVKGDAELFKIFQDTGRKKCPKCGSENLKDVYWYRVDCLDCGWLYIGEDIGRMAKPKPTPKPTTPKPTPLPEHRPKCLHPKNYGAYCDEGCPERDDFGVSPLDIAVALADYIDCEYHSDVVKKKEEMKKIKDMTDSELIDKYIDWDEFLEHTAGFGLTEGAGIDEWRSINAEIKRRGITDNQIETRRKELYKKWGIKYDRK